MTKSTELKKLIESTCEEFGRMLDSEAPTRLEDFLQSTLPDLEIAQSDQSRLMAALISEEVQWKHRRGLPVEASEYAARFPQFDRNAFDDLISLPRPPSKSLATERQLPSNYRVLGKIGEGGIGTILRVHDERMNRELAVKSLKPDLRSKWAANQRLSNEAELTGRLQHPGIPPVFEQGVLANGSCYFAMKLVEGRTLSELLKSSTNDKPDVADLIQVFEQVAQTLAYAHAKGIVHRDIKPDNIMVGEFAEIQVMDWGMAKDVGGATQAMPKQESNAATIEPSTQTEVETANASIDSSIDVSLGIRTRQGDVIGTPAYMSPEQARGDTDLIDYRSDVFGLGHLLFEILTGKRLFSSGSADDVLDRLKSSAELNVKQRLANVDVDRELIDLCCRCLERDPDDRPSNAGEVAAAVGRYQANLQQRLRQSQIDQRAAEVKASEESKRRRIATWLGAGIVASVAIGLLGVLWQLNQANNARRIADERFVQAKKTVDEYLLEVSGSKALLDSTSGTQQLRRRLLQRAQTYYLEFVKTKPDDPELQDELAEAYLSLGEISSELVSDDEPLEYFDEAIQLSMDLIESDRDLPGTANRVVKAMNRKSMTLARLGKLQESKLCIDEALEFADSPLDSFDEVVVGIQLSEMYRREAFLFEKMAKESDAKVAIERAIDHTKELFDIHPGNEQVATSFAATLFRNGTLNYIARESDAAKADFEQAIEIYSGLAGDEADDELRYRIATCQTALAETFWQMGNADKSIELLNQSASKLEVLFRDNPAVLDYVDDLAEAKTLLAKFMFESKRDGGFDIATSVIEQLRTTLKSHPTSQLLLLRLGYVLAGRSEDLRAQGKYRDALKYREEALDAYNRVRKLAPDDVQAKKYVVRCLQGIGVLHRRLDDLNTAKEYYGKAIAMIDTMKENGEGSNDLLSIQAGVSNNLGFLNQIEGKYEQAIAPFEGAIDAYLELANGDAASPDFYYSGSSMTNLGFVHACLLNHESAIAEFDRAVDVLDEAVASRKSDRRATDFLFGAVLLRSQSYLAVSRFEKCEADLERCLEIEKGPFRIVAKLKQLALKTRQGIAVPESLESAEKLLSEAEKGLPMSDVLVETARVYLCAALDLKDQANVDEDLLQTYLEKTANLLEQAASTNRFAICSKRFQDDWLVQPFLDRAEFSFLAE